MNRPKFAIPLLPSRRRDRGHSVLALTLGGGQLQGVEVRKTNDLLQPGRSFNTPLTLDLLTAEPELVGREIRKHLDAAGVRERHCVVGLPENWVLTLASEVPDLSEADRAGFLQLEAERGFSSGSDSLILAHSLSRGTGGGRRALVAGVPRQHVARLEAVLAAAQLRPVGFSLASNALQPPEAEGARTAAAVWIERHQVHLVVNHDGGVAVLRTLEGAYESEAGAAQLQPDLLVRELRITLGQLPTDIAEALRVLRVFGHDEPATELVEVLRPRLGPLGIEVEPVRRLPAATLPHPLPAGTAISPALALAARYLAGPPAVLEFLPPRIGAWQRLTERYASRRIVWAGAAAGALAGVVALAFGIQQARLAYWGSRWNAMKSQVNTLADLQRSIRQFRPWYDESCRSLDVLRRLTEAFPEDGAVSAKSVEIHERSGITCAGTARDNPSWLRTLDRLQATPEIADIKVEQMRGRSPMQFRFHFQWVDSPNP